jgi:hypothetical protein
LRRQATTSRATPAGSSRVERLDPFALPVRFENADHAADERVRMIELHRERVVLRRALCGIKMAVNLPVAAYQGVAIRMQEIAASSPSVIAVVLEHPDPALSVTLCCAADGTESSRNGNPGVARSACRFWSRGPTAACAGHSNASGAFTWAPRCGVGAAMECCTSGGQPCRCGEHVVCSLYRRSSTSTSARSSPAIEPAFGGLRAMRAQKQPAARAPQTGSARHRDWI